MADPIIENRRRCPILGQRSVPRRRLRRARTGFVVGLALALVATPALGGKSKRGYIDADLMEGRQLEWLEFATEEPMNPGSVANVLGHLERAERDPAYSVPAGSIPDDSWDGIFDKMWRLRDTSDFDALRFIDLLYAHGGDPAGSEALWQAVEQSLLDFKYDYADPTPERLVDGEQVVDNMWYWTENHHLIFRVCEYLAGQRMKKEVFSVTGLTGKEHMKRAEPFLLKWLE